MNQREAQRFPLIRAFALIAWNNETNAWFNGERASDGYIIQEVYRRRTANSELRTANP